jgi:excisionase family DNA binding protein
MPERPTPLYVRIATDSARLIDEAVSALGVTKRQVVEDAVRHHLGEQQREFVVGRVTMQEPLPDVLTVGEAAVLLKVSEADVRAAAESGDLPGRRIGDEWRFGRDALMSWLGAAAPQA